MSFKSMVREMRDGIGNISKRRPLGQHFRNRGRSHIAPEIDLSSYLLIEQTQWANLPPELLLDIIHRLEASETTWPARRDVVACAAVCKSWRDVTKELVKTPEKCGWLTFPISLKQPGPREYPIQCFIKRERGTSTYQLYLGLSPALSGDMNKMLLAAKKIRRAITTDFVISLAGDDFSRTSTAYIGKLRSNFLGTKFTVFDTQPPGHDSATNKPNQRLYSKQAPLNYKMVTVSYELNVLRTRGPRRMQCAMHSIPMSSIQEGGTAPTPTELRKYPDEDYPHLAVPKEKKKPPVDFSSTNVVEPVYEEAKEPLSLKNKAPRWHEQLQCWCLNFKGRVTVASVKNFQLVAAVDAGQNVSAEEQEKVILQFGKIGKDIFTMDYRYPLSAFQAFAICLSSFDTKPACE